MGRQRSNSGSRSLRLAQALSFNRMPTIQDENNPPSNSDRVDHALKAQNKKAAGGANGAAMVNQQEYASNIVDFLDVIDPEVSTLSSITNVQNSLFVPSLGRFVNRRPTYDISFVSKMPGAFPEVSDEEKEDQSRPASRPASRQTTQQTPRQSVSRAFSITSEITDSHYAVLPSGVSLEGWTQEEVDQLNDHVRHMLHSRRNKLKRGLKAFGKYVRKPLGFAVTLYATLITLFGLAWVLFLIGWIYVGDKNLYVINVIDNVLVALFAIVGDGLAPFRAVDTYHMIFIVHYHRLTWKLRKKMFLPDLENKNDLPAETVDPPSGRQSAEALHGNLEDLEARVKEQEESVNREREEAANREREEAANRERDEATLREQEEAADKDLEAGEPEKVTRDDAFERHEVSVLNQKQQDRLVYHQNKMSKSHTFYKPHETETHHAFPISFLIAIVLLLDLHSCLQITLGSITWSTDYHHRSSAATTTVLCCSITANTLAGVLIAIGDRRTRKKDVIERMFRQELTDYAMRKVEKERKKQEEKEAAARKDAEQVGRFDASTHFPRMSTDLSEGIRDEINREEKNAGESSVPGSFPSPA